MCCVTLLQNLQSKWISKYEKCVLYGTTLRTDFRWYFMPKIQILTQKLTKNEILEQFEDLRFNFLNKIEC